MNDHDPADPLGYLNAIEAAALCARLPACPHCYDTRQVIHMSGAGWGVETTHEPTCPNHEDNQPASEFDGTDLPLP